MKVMKFGAVWCPGCLIMKPRWEEIEKENPWLKTEYHDYDEDKELAEKWQVTDIPAFIFLSKKGEEITRLYGEVDKSKLISIINEYKNK